MASVAKREWTHNGEPKSAWVVRYKDRDGAHRSRQFTRKKEAETYRAKVAVEVNEGRHIAPTVSGTITDLLKDFLADAEQRRRDGRRMSENYLRHLQAPLRNHVEPALGHIIVQELTWADVDRWAKELAAKRLSVGTRSKIMQIFKRVIDFAEVRGRVHKNVVASVRRHHGGAPVEKVRTFTKEEMQRLLAVLNVRGERRERRAWEMTRATVYLAAFCGLRRGEIMALCWENLDLEARVVRVRHSLDDWGELRAPKTRAGVRDVPMPAALVMALKSWRPFSLADTCAGFVFQSAKGRRIEGSSYHNGYWKPLLKRAGFAPDEGGRWHHFHALRHFTASMYIEAGVSLPTVATLLGHRTFDMTLQVYAHQIAGGHRDGTAVEGMAAQLLPNSVTHGLLTAA